MVTPHSLIVRAELQIHQNLRTMTELAGQSVEAAMDALKSQDAALAQQVVDSDQKLNTLLRLVEQECLEALALLEPKAVDLREIIASLQIATELERIGDHGKDIANIVLSMDAGDFSGPMDRLAAMGDLCHNMLTRVMESYENMDAALATSVAAEDREVDDLDEEASANLMMTVMTAPDTSMHATHLLWIAYHLERVGDRVTNIAERVVFMVNGETPELG